MNTVTAGFSELAGILYDGSNIWVTDYSAGKLFKLDASGNILQTVAVGSGPLYSAFDGANIWVPNIDDNSISVVKPGNPAKVVATIVADSNNRLNRPAGAAFDGERVLVTNNAGSSVTLFKAADLSFIANVTTGTGTAPAIPCSDGINFWVPLFSTGNLLRF